MNEYLLICSCSGMDKKATIAYEILFPNTPIPQVIKGKEAIAKLASKYHNSHIKAISKLSGNYAYYIKISDSGKILDGYDLLVGRRTN